MLDRLQYQTVVACTCTCEALQCTHADSGVHALPTLPYWSKRALNVHQPHHRLGLSPPLCVVGRLGMLVFLTADDSQTIDS